jgi:hypothetical protein
MRIELTPSAWKAEALPICNIRIVPSAGIEPATQTLEESRSIP